MKKYTFFWKSNSPFSNWYKSKFIHNGIIYNCSEQYMMYQKALLFNDLKTAQKILETESPKEQKDLGRQIKNFNPDVWDKNCFSIMLKGLKEKFLQNEDCLNALEQAKNTILVEASPVDRIWGIGYAEDSALNHIDSWGENRLGKLLNQVIIEIF